MRQPILSCEHELGVLLNFDLDAKTITRIQEIEQSKSWIKFSKPPTGLHRHTERHSLHITMPNKPPLYNRNKPNPQYTHLVITGEVHNVLSTYFNSSTFSRSFLAFRLKTKRNRGEPKKERWQTEKKEDSLDPLGPLTTEHHNTSSSKNQLKLEQCGPRDVLWMATDHCKKTNVMKSLTLFPRKIWAIENI